MIAIDSTNLVSLEGLFNASTRLFVDDATVAFRVLLGVAEIVASTPMSAAGSGGDYSGVFNATAFVEDSEYTVEILVDAAGSLAKYHVIAKAGYLTSNPCC